VTTGGEFAWDDAISHCEEQTHQLVFGVLNCEPLNDCDRRIGLGTEQAVTPWQLRPASSSCRDSLRTPKEEGPPTASQSASRKRSITIEGSTSVTRNDNQREPLINAAEINLALART